MKYYEDKSDRKMELKLLSLSEDDKLIRECMEQASAFYGCLGKMGVTEILCDRKKAQELGADCQITGIFTGGELTAFACAFEYTGLKRNGRKWLNPGDKEWRQIETLGTNVVVIPLLVGKEKVGRLIELLREQYRDSHLLFRISGEQSEKFQKDLAVVSEKNLKSHRYDAAGENVWLFHFAPQIRMEDTYFEEEILLILPGQEVLLEMGIEEAEVTMVKLTGYEIVRSEKGSAFFRKPGAACEGVLLQCDYEQLLRYQRFINLTNYEEHFEQTDRGKALIYSEKYQSDSSLLWNDLLREMVKTRKAEWRIVPDSYIMYPVTYKDHDRLLECACYDNQEIGNYMHYMAKQKDPFALSIEKACTIYDEGGYKKVNDKWTEYVGQLKKFVKDSTMNGQMDLDAQKNLAMGMINEVEIGSKQAAEELQDAYREMEKYKDMVVKRSEDTARTIAYSIFKAKNDSITKEKLPHQMETYLRDEEGNFIHPNAVRYFLYQALELMKAEKVLVEKENDKKEKSFDGMYAIFDNTKTDDEIETVDQLTERKIDKKTQQEFKDKLRFYIGETDKYRTSSVLAEVLAEGIDYISSLCEAFQNFYTSFENRIEALDRRIAALSKKYGNTAGRTSRYVCATPNCFQRLLKEMPYTGSSITIDKELAEEIYNKVRNYSMLKDKPENGGYFEQIFDNGIIGYFKKSLMEIYGSTVNMDVLTALEKEAKYEKNEYDATRIEQYVKKVIAETRNLSNPFIERPLGEQKAPIAACTYSKELDPKDDSPRSMLIAKELGNYGGTPDEDIPLNMIMFYQSIYGLRANKLSKFSPGCAAEGRSDGEYYKAYYEVVSQIKPKSDKTPVITPHIDRNWHIVSALPDLDEENQRRQEREIYRAFALGIICDLVCYSKISEGKYLYRLELNDLEPEEFVVSNGTPCDHYYEVLDALTINPVAVQTILSYMKEKFADERNSSGKLDFEHSYLRRQINELASIEYGKAGLSIFDVALLLKVSTPSAEFDKTVGKGIMREILTLIYEYAQTMVLEADLDGIYGKFVLEQFEMFDKNIDWYMDNWKDNFSDYINDLMRIAVSDIERKKLTDIYEKMRKIMKESSKKRG